MRPPRLDMLTVRRGVGKLLGWMAPSRGCDGKASLPEGLSVIDTKMWPWMACRHDRWLNRWLLTRQLSSAAQGHVAVTTVPIVADLVGHLPVRRWVYYCVDDFSVWPGLDGRAMGEMEDTLLPKMDKIIAASDILAEKIAARGYQSQVLTHGVDLDFWSLNAAGKPLGSSVAQRGFPGGLVGTDCLPPIALFWGVVDRRLDS
jgi:hypothetical protein